MSDANQAPGEPASEGRPEDDVVVSANESLADAEAAQRDIDADEDARYAAYAAYAEEPVVESESATGADASAQPVVVEERTTVVEPASEAATTAYAAEDVTTAYEPPASITPSEPAAVAPVAPVAPAAPQPIFVQAPEEPRARGNRAAVGGIGLLAALSFAVLYLAAYLGIGLISGEVTWEGIVDPIVEALTSWWLWVATAVFFLGFWLFGAIINRGRWGYWVIWGLLMGVIGYGAHLVGWLFQAPFWQMTRSEGVEFVETQLIAPLAFFAFVIARELTIWFGAWAAARGRRLDELNTEARREYERTLEAGPQLVR